MVDAVIRQDAVASTELVDVAIPRLCARECAVNGGADSKSGTPPAKRLRHYHLSCCAGCCQLVRDQPARMWGVARGVLVSG